MRFLASLRQKKVLFHAGVIVMCAIASFLVALKSPFMIDDPIRLHHSHLVLGNFGLGEKITEDFGTRYYAPLFEFFLGIATEWIFFAVKDPFWIRHALTIFSQFLGLHLLFFLLRDSGISRSGSILAISVMAAQIRLNGEALFNMKDAPGAMSYLLSGVGIWILLRGGQIKGKFSLWRLTSMGIVSAIPFLIRAPLLTPLPFALGGLLLVLLLDKRLRGDDDVIFPVLWCACACFAFIAAVSPYMWTLDASEWLKPFFFFKDFPYGHDVARAFGYEWKHGKVPWWYGLAWIPTEVPPLALFIVILGAILPFVRRSDETKISFVIRGKAKGVSLRSWLMIYALISWLAFIAFDPKVYEEDRHLLFLFPPLFLACALGLDRLGNRTKYLLGCVVMVAAINAYWHWGWYSYTYKSILLYPKDPTKYEGDFRYTCGGRAIASMKPLLKEDVNFVVSGGSSEKWFIETFQQSLVRGDTAYNHLIFVDSEKGLEAPYYLLSVRHKIVPQLERVARGESELVYKEDMPDGMAGCIITRILQQP